jgi:hypothetical protein
MKKILFNCILVLGLLSPVVNAADEKTTIQGKAVNVVYYQNQKISVPVPNKMLAIYEGIYKKIESAHQPLRVIATKSDGTYSFSVPKGIYTIVICDKEGKRPVGIRADGYYYFYDTLSNSKVEINVETLVPLEAEVSSR